MVAIPGESGIRRHGQRRGGDLLILQSSALMGRALARHCKRVYARVIVMTDPAAADAWLTRNADTSAGHDLVCGVRFQGTATPISKWLARWRQKGWLRRLVVASAEPASAGSAELAAAEVSAEFSKPFAMADLLHALRYEDAQQGAA